MDRQRFDELARRLAGGGISRRRLVQAMGGGPRGGLGGLTGHDRVGASGRPE